MADSKPSDPERPPGSTGQVAFIDLEKQLARIRRDVDLGIAAVLDSGAFIMGPQVAEFERQLAAFCGAQHAVACSSGTDALLVALMARGIGPGDGVLCPAFTYTATPEVISLLGATPVFVDVREDTFNLDPDALDEAIECSLSQGVRPKVVMPVDLFGQPAEYDRILPTAEKHGLFVLSDAAQGFGSSHPLGRAGRLGNVTATSFFPAKPLGCYGDGGAMLTDDGDLAEKFRSIILHGKGAAKYDIVRVGINGRLDTIQAAVLIEKLKIFPDEIVRRQAVAERYNELLAGLVPTPAVLDGYRSVWAQYTIRLPAERRLEVQKALANAGVPTQVYYPRPLHHQPAYAKHVMPKSGLPVSERLSNEVLSLPMHPYLTAGEQDRVCEALRSALA